MLKVGDKVRVRRWKDMVNEFGYDKSSINCDFVDDMKIHCEKVYQIRKIYGDEVIWLNGISWDFSADMLEDPNTGKAVSIA